MANPIAVPIAQPTEMSEISGHSTEKLLGGLFNLSNAFKANAKVPMRPLRSHRNHKSTAAKLPPRQSRWLQL